MLITALAITAAIVTVALWLKGVLMAGESCATVGAGVAGDGAIWVRRVVGDAGLGGGGLWGATLEDSKKNCHGYGQRGKPDLPTMAAPIHFIL